jgi:2-oxo-4-hydroxy-4-carboxy-5-ureidoimidazoline decarboxylase
MADTTPGSAVAALDRLNRAGLAEFSSILGGVFEHSPWVAERAWRKRPFSDVADLHAAMMDVVVAAPTPDRLALLRAHPELAGREAMAGAMTEASTGEQGRLGLDRLTAAELAHITRINAAYRERFGFPCIIALRLHEARGSVLEEMARRLDNDRASEIERALEQIAHITRGRLEKLLEDA